MRVVCVAVAIVLSLVIITTVLSARHEHGDCRCPGVYSASNENVEVRFTLQKVAEWSSIWVFNFKEGRTILRFSNYVLVISKGRLHLTVSWYRFRRLS